MPSKWGKLMEIWPTRSGAITNAAGPEANRIALAAQDEGKEILAQAGIRWVPAKEAAHRPPTNITPPPDYNFGRPLGSTWQSLVRNQGTVETEFLNGEIVRLAVERGIPAPVNQALLRITLEMAANHEKPGKYTPPNCSKYSSWTDPPSGNTVGAGFPRYSTLVDVRTRPPLSLNCLSCEAGIHQTNQCLKSDGLLMSTGKFFPRDSLSPIRLLSLFTLVLT